MSRPIRIAFLVVDDRFDKDLPVPYFGTAPTALLKGFEELGRDQVEVHIVSCLARPLPCPEKLADNIWFHGEYVPKWGFLRTLHSGCIRAVRRMVNDIQPDIVHAQGGERWCAVSGALLPYPKLLTLHGILRVIDPLVKLQPRPYWKLQTFLERLAVPRFDGLICITSHARRQIEDWAKQTWIIPNATDPRYFELARNPSDPPVILYVGSIYSLKNQVGFVDALEPLARELKFIVRFCGHLDRNTPFGAQLGERIDRFSWCEEAGHLNREQIERELEKASLLALVSFEENCPMVILEAMSAGVPVVASMAGGIPDLIQDESNGLLCLPDNAESIRTAVRRMLTEPELAMRCANQAKEDADTRYTPKVVAEQHLKVYRDLLDQHASKRRIPKQ